MPLSSEAFMQVLIEIRDGAQDNVLAFGFESVREGAKHDAKIDDVRAVWHAAEIALGMLHEDYYPKREAVADAPALLDKWDAPGS
jgi:hypothetical protein